MPGPIGAEAERKPGGARASDPAEDGPVSTRFGSPLPAGFGERRGRERGGAARPEGPKDRSPRPPDPMPGSGRSAFDFPYLLSLSVTMVCFASMLYFFRLRDGDKKTETDLHGLHPRMARYILPKKAPKPRVFKSRLRAAPPPARPEAMDPDLPEKRPRPAAAKAAPEPRPEPAKRLSREGMQEQVGKAEQRLKRARIGILSGQGPGTSGASVGKALKGAGFRDWDDLDRKLRQIEGLSAFEGGSLEEAARGTAASAAPRQGREAGSAGTAKLRGLLDGMAAAKTASARKIGEMEFERPALVGRRFTGNRNPQEVANTLSRRQAAIRLLYEERLRTDPTLEGKITLVFVIEGDGSVSEASVLESETSLADAELQEAILRQVRRWTFPPSNGGAVEMKFPFVFRPA